MGKHKHTIAVAVLVYLLMSFMPQLGLMNLIGKKPALPGSG